MNEDKEQVLKELYKYDLMGSAINGMRFEELMEKCNFTNRNYLLAHMRYLKEKELIDFDMSVFGEVLGGISITAYGVDYIEDFCADFVRNLEVKK